MKYFTFGLLLFFGFGVMGQEVGQDEGNGGGAMVFDFPCASEDACNLIIYNGLFDWVTGTPYSGGQEVEDEDGLGAITIANKNDTDGDGNIDNSDMNGVVASSVGRNEIDLMRLDIKKPIPDVGGSAVLTIVSENVRLWENPNKTMAIVFPNNTVSFPTSELDKTIYVEALEESQNVKDIQFKLEYNGFEDIVKATAIWIRKGGSGDDNDEAWFMNTVLPVAGEGDLSDLDEDNLLNRINVTNKSMDNRRYGHGTFFSAPILSDNSDNDKRFGGRILFEFRILPEDLTGSDLAPFVYYDITRQKKNRLYKIISGGDLGAFVSDKSLNFPWEGSPWQGIPVGDNELPNDDMNPNDEDNVPSSNGRLYSFDPPGTDRYDIEDELLAFKINLIEFREFARVKFMSNFNQSNQNELDGSRCSEKNTWSCSYYVKRSNNGLYKMVADNDPVSASFPIKTSNFGANGTVSISTQNTAPTQKYKLTFDKDGSNSKWKLEVNGSMGMSVESAASEMGPWIINWATNGVSITINQGSIVYQNNNGYTFSVFSTQNPMGKQNMISEMDFDATINP